jgi:hypothetical protein
MTAGQIAKLGLEAAEGAVDAARDANVVIIANDHPELSTLDQAAIGSACRKPALIYNLSGSAFPTDAGFGPGVKVRTFGVADWRTP